jgi:hypothetical protein
MFVGELLQVVPLDWSLLLSVTSEKPSLVHRILSQPGEIAADDPRGFARRGFIGFFER